MNVQELVNEIEKHKKLYRDGNAEISDVEYDNLLLQLEQLDPDHYLLHKVEEEEFEKPTVKHPKPMLSIEKVFSSDDLQKWFNRVEKKYSNLKYKVTPKLDGLAARYSDGVLCTRGDGYAGYDISDAFDKGLVVFSNLQDGDIGEIVMDKRYFEKYLSDRFVHPRNIVVGAVKCDKLSEIQKKSFDNGSIHFVPYRNLIGYHDYSDNIIKNINDIIENLSNTIFPIDGYVIEVEYESIKNELGHTSHHYRWNVAYKEQTEIVRTTVKNITWQTGRGGNITPVLEVEPVKVSGAVVSRITAHNQGYLRKKKLGIGTEIEIIRSGEVIPKVYKIVDNESTLIETVYRCPSCSEHTIKINDIIKCPNFSCPAQAVGRLKHFFKSLRIDLFGEKTLEKLVNYENTTIQSLFVLDKLYYETIGFGPRQSERLVNSIKYMKTQTYEDYKILSAISIPLIGRSESKKLMEKYTLSELFNLSVSDFNKLAGFGEKKPESLYDGLRVNKDTLNFLMNNLNISNTKEKNVMSNSGIQGKSFVFTGKMEQNTRKQMQDLCEQNGGTAQTSVSSQTDFLVMGEKVGKSKIQKAEKWGIMKISENEFMDMVEF